MQGAQRFLIKYNCLKLPSIRSLSYVEQARLLEKIKTDDGFCESHLKEGKFLLYNKGKPLLQKKDHSPTWVDFKTTMHLNPEVEKKSVALSVDADGVAKFACGIGKDAEFTDVETATSSKFIDLRIGLFLVNSQTAHTLSKGWSLLRWNDTNNFCSKCGKPLIRQLSGAGSKCSNCTSVFYPSTSPVGIVSVEDPDTRRLLLIRQPRYPKGMYSCIAGFLDVGETLEDCVKREVAEEVGMQIESVQYIRSQHWPFPAGSLMIGCHAIASPNQNPDPCKVELEDARWFTRDEVEKAVNRIQNNPRLRVGKDNNPSEIFVAPKGAVAHELVTYWLQNQQ